MAQITSFEHFVGQRLQMSQSSERPVRNPLVYQQDILDRMEKGLLVLEKPQVPLEEWLQLALN